MISLLSGQAACCHRQFLQTIRKDYHQQRCEKLQASLLAFRDQVQRDHRLETAIGSTIYYNYMRRLKSTLNISSVEPSIPQPQPQTATDAMINTIFKIRHDIMNAIVKKNRF